MREDFRKDFDVIINEVIYCHYYWFIYRELFGTNDNRVKIINDTNPSMFLILQGLFLDYFTLSNK